MANNSSLVTWDKVQPLSPIFAANALQAGGPGWAVVPGTPETNQRLAAKHGISGLSFTAGR